MEHRITPLIAERAPWLHARAAWPLRIALERLLGFKKTVDLADRLAPQPADAIMAQMATMIARHIDVSGLGHIPQHGPALIVANHPTGIADGIILHALISRQRDDAYFFANSDILRVLPQMSEVIVPVEWRSEKRSRAKTRATLAALNAATQMGRIGVIFPSGRLAKRRGIRLDERPWMSSAAALARKSGLPVIPINIRARNSVLFYLLDIIHPTLRDVTLFHETLNKARQRFTVTVGEPISPQALPADPREATAMLRRATMALGAQSDPVTRRRQLRPLSKH